MGIEFLLERFNELSSGFTQLASKYPFELGILIGAAGMAFVWWGVSLRSASRTGGNAENSGGSQGTKNLTIEDVREKARRRL